MRGHDRVSRQFTVVIVPHAAGEVASFRVPILAAQVVCTLAAAFWIGLLVFFRSYVAMRGAVDELVSLRAAQRASEARYAELVRQVAEVERRLAQLQALDRRIRTLLDDLPAAQPSDAAPAASPVAAAGRGGAAVVPGEVPDPAELRLRLLDLGREVQARIQGLQAAIADLRARQALYAVTPTLWPVRGIITSDFGWRRDPFSWRRSFHTGVDIAAPYGATAVATAAGTVTFAGWDEVLGWTVVVDHGTYATRYGHLAELAVRPGQRVAKGQPIGRVGSSGRSTGPHLHYEVYEGGRLLDPRPFLLER